MSSFVANSTTAQEIVNWVTTADGWVHTADTTQLDFTVAARASIHLGQGGRVPPKFALGGGHQFHCPRPS